MHIQKITLLSEKLNRSQTYINITAYCCADQLDTTPH